MNRKHPCRDPESIGRSIAGELYRSLLGHRKQLNALEALTFVEIVINRAETEAKDANYSERKCALISAAACNEAHNLVGLRLEPKF